MNIVKSDINKWRVSIALLIIALCLVAIPLKVGAAITSPYIVDEKLQVRFGDTATIVDGEKTYFGLENYQHEYVGGYLHITFTYTHGYMEWASYPPMIYITDQDPRSTTTLATKIFIDTYQISSLAPSDWYLYDIQLDATGFKLIVTQSGKIEIDNRHIDTSNLVDSFWVSLANTYPLSDNNQPNEYSMSHTPVPLKSNVEPPQPTRNPVIIVPGIMGSYLNKEDGTEVWMNLLKMVVSDTDLYLNDLSLDSTGQPSDNFHINASNIIRSVDVPLFRRHIFDDLINEFIDNGYEEGKDLFIFPYDWRLDLTQTSNTLREKIEQIKLQTGAEKVDIVAHSMGGLLIKKFIKENENNSIDKFVDVGTPHLGAPKSFSTLMYGDTDIGILNQNTIRDLSQNMPSIYELLPSRNYVALSPYIYDLDDLDNNGIQSSLDYEQTKTFLKNMSKNNMLIDQADLFHREIDNLDLSNNGVNVFNIVGCGTETLGKIFILNKESSGGVEYNISYTNGDGTVPLDSAKSLPSENLFYYKKAIHALMPSTPSIKALIVAILNNEIITPSNYTDISTLESDCPGISGQIVSFHSPIDMHIYDSQNRHVGPTENGDIENNIPGVSYEIIDGNKFVFLPNGEDYKVIGKATSEGKFNARIEKVNNEVIVETKYFNEVPILTTTQIALNVNSSTLNKISIDNNSDGIFEAYIEASSVLNQNQSSDLIRPITTIGFKGNRTKDGAFISSVQISLIAIDENAGILKTEYSFDGGLKWNKYIEPFTVNSRGGVKIIYKSTDKAGNVEVLKESNINIIYPANSGKKI